MRWSAMVRQSLTAALLIASACSDDDESTATQQDAGSFSTAMDGARRDANAPPNDTGRAANSTPPRLDGGSMLSFFVTSDKSMTGNLGGLAGADARCRALASTVGAASKTWNAYLSVERDPANANMPTHARDRIGSGPWYNVNGVLVARNLNELHARKGDADVFIDEHGSKINGQWDPSLQPNEHDILTGSDASGRVLAGMTCSDWTSDSAMLTAQVGHSDGFGPNRDTSMGRDSWNSAHANRGCNDTAPAGGAGRLYCFAAD